MKKHFFNMVEIALAMVVISLGITGILGLFSVGVNAKKAAINENNVADAAEYVLGVCKAFICNEYERGAKISSDSPPFGLNGPISDKELDKIAWSVDDDILFTLDGSDGKVEKNKSSGLYHKKVDDKDDKDDKKIPQVFCYMAVRRSDDGKLIADTQLQGYIWAEQVPVTFVEKVKKDGKVIDQKKKVLVEYMFGVRVYLELSWPVDKPYANRDKKVFVMDVINPQLDFRGGEHQSGTGDE